MSKKQDAPTGQVQREVMQRRVLLEKAVPDILRHIGNNAHKIISDEGLIESSDYRNIEKYSVADQYLKESDGKRYYVGYRLYLIVKEDIV